MAGPKVRILVDLLEEHFEEFQFLWELRQAALRSPLHTLRTFLELEERLEAHVQGLLLGGDVTTHLVEPGLKGEEPLPAFAAAYTLLRLNQPPATLRVLKALREAKGPQLGGIREAFCHAYPGTLLRPLKALPALGAGPVAAAAVEVLAWHSSLDLEAEQWQPFLQHDDEAVRQTAWRTLQLGVARLPDAYPAGLRDASPAVRREALLAAAWNRQAWLLDYCRKLAAAPTPEQADVLLLFAVLGKPTDLHQMMVLGQAAKLGPMRFRVLGSYGHPGGVEILLHALEDKDPRSAVAAGAAFTKITGVDVASGRRVQLPPADGSEPDEFEKEFLDEAFLPDAAQAREYWQKHKDHYGKGTRWCRGLDLSQGGDPDVWDELDMESRWEAYLRGAHETHWQGRPVELERFPHQPTK